MLISKELKERAIKIKRLLKKSKLHDDEIAKILNIPSYDVVYCRRIFKIKSGYTIRECKLKATEPIKKAICMILNKEHPQKPLSDEKIKAILKNKHNIESSRSMVWTYRCILNIPKAKKRKQIYFMKGRMIWKTNMIH